MNRNAPALLAALSAVVLPLSTLASSHREAPFITTRPKVDATDFFLFNSYDPARPGFVDIIANYQPFEFPQGGPNYYFMDPNALYEILIDNTGSGTEAITFQFRFNVTDAGATVTAGTKAIPVPLVNVGPISAPGMATQNVSESYTITMVTGDRRSGATAAVTNASGGSATFAAPLDNIGAKTFPTGYAAYAASFIYTINIPNCSTPGKVFVGQRADPFVVNLGETFDLVNYRYPAQELYPGFPAVATAGRNISPNSLANFNVTSIALEIPTSCLTTGTNTIIGGWTAASVRQATVLNPVPQSSKSVGSVGAVASPTGAAVQGGAWNQVSRLSAPLVNELIIGLPDKDRFDFSEPKNDAQFADYVTNPSLPILLQTLFGADGVVAPNVYPRTDLEAAFLTGVAGLNKPATVTPAEMERLQTNTNAANGGIAVTPLASQNDLGVLGGDLSGFPNGRRPIDDVVDIELRVAMGALLTPFNGTASDPDPASDASRQLHYTDGTEPNPANYLPTFPYVNTPYAGSPTSGAD